MVIFMKDIMNVFIMNLTQKDYILILKIIILSLVMKPVKRALKEETKKIIIVSHVI